MHARPNRRQALAMSTLAAILWLSPGPRPAGAESFSFLETHTDGIDGIDGIDGLNGARGVEISPDSRHVYVASSFDDGLVAFAREGSRLVFIEVHIDGQGGVSGIDGARHVAISPDGLHLYVSGFNDSTIAIFSRDPASGALTFVASVPDSTHNLVGTHGLVVSPDGLHVYATGRINDTVAVFLRNAGTGQLTFLEGHQDNTAGVDGIDGAHGLAISGDGRHLYVAGQSEEAMAVFARAPATGALLFVEALRDDLGGINGLNEPSWVTVSHDGGQVYVANHLGTDVEDDWLAVFDRDATAGTLTFREAHPRPTLPGCGGLQSELDSTLRATADGRWVFATAPIRNAVVAFSRDAGTGALTFADHGCEAVGGALGTSGTTGLAISSDGGHLYATAQFDHGVAAWVFALFADGFESGDASAWTSQVPP